VPITQAQVAAVAGVTQAAVSLALRNDPKLPKATRERIRAIAKEIGYVPDPRLAALSRYRHGGRRGGQSAALGFLVSEATADWWRRQPLYRDIYDGAMEAAASLGYQMTLQVLPDAREDQRRLARTLSARGVRGLLVISFPHAGAELAWLDEKFVTLNLFGENSIPGQDVVVSNHYSAMRLAFRQILGGATIAQRSLCRIRSSIA
jgi:DNA-binding LacI/PurR family transcriptional regulator